MSIYWDHTTHTFIAALPEERPNNVYVQPQAPTTNVRGPVDLLNSGAPFPPRRYGVNTNYFRPTHRPNNTPIFATNQSGSHDNSERTGDPTHSGVLFPKRDPNAVIPRLFPSSPPGSGHHGPKNTIDPKPVSNRQWLRNALIFGACANGLLACVHGGKKQIVVAVINAAVALVASQAYDNTLGSSEPVYCKLEHMATTKQPRSASTAPVPSGSLSRSHPGWVEGDPDMLDEQFAAERKEREERQEQTRLEMEDMRKNRKNFF